METLFVGRNIIFLPELESTNSYAISLLKNVNLKEGTVINTASQTKGKGQRGLEWVSEPSSNLTFSVVFNPVFLDLKNQFYLYQISSLACYDAMAEYIDVGQDDIKIKWPNDILVNGKKIAGILIENNLINNQIKQCVMGFGININQNIFSSKLKATSLNIITGLEYDLGIILSRVCFHLEKYYIDLMQDNFEKIKACYLLHFFGLNTWMNFEIDDITQPFLLKGIGIQGLLLLEDTNSDVREYDLKDIKWLF